MDMQLNNAIFIPEQFRGGECDGKETGGLDFQGEKKGDVAGQVPSATSPRDESQNCDILLFHVDHIIEKLIDGGDDFRVGLKGALDCDHLDKLPAHIDIRLFQGVGENFSQFRAG